jgi:hypothetical protein
MEYIEIITLAFIGLGAFVLQWKNDVRFVSFINLLLTAVVVLVMKRFNNIFDRVYFEHLDLMSIPRQGRSFELKFTFGF